jgi:aryl-alcohol dehydrogenase-like predicted oxidoreductase
MKYRKLGTSDLSVSEISLGSWFTTYGIGVDWERASGAWTAPSNWVSTL